MRASRRRHRLAAWLAALALTVTALPAEAAPVGSDVVHLADGGFYRGTILVLERGKRVVIQLADGRTEEIAWDRIKDVELGKTEPAAPKPPPANTETPPANTETPPANTDAPPAKAETTPAPRRPAEGEIPDHVQPAEMPGYSPAVDVLDPDAPREVALRVEAESAVRVMRRRGGESELLCEAPCGEFYEVSPSDEFYVEGDDMPSSRSFELYDANGKIEAVVETGSSALYVSGIVVAVVGFSSGVVLGGVTLAERQGLSYFPPEPEPVATAVGSGVGLLVGVAGTVLATLSDTELTVVDEGLESGRGGFSWRF